MVVLTTEGLLHANALCAAGMLWCALLAAKQPRSLTAARLGVGACLWDGAFVLTAYLLTQPSDTFTGIIDSLA